MYPTILVTAMSIERLKGSGTIHTVHVLTQGAGAPAPAYDGRVDVQGSNRAPATYAYTESADSVIRIHQQNTGHLGFSIRLGSIFALELGVALNCELELDWGISAPDMKPWEYWRSYRASSSPMVVVTTTATTTIAATATYDLPAGPQSKAAYPYFTHGEHEASESHKKTHTQW